MNHFTLISPLQAANGFDRSTLLWNRQNRLAKSQMRQLIRSLLSKLAFACFGLVVVICPLLLGGFDLLIRGLTTDDTFALVVNFLFAVFAVLLIYVIYQRIVPLLIDIMRGEVAIERGRVTMHKIEKPAANGSLQTYYAYGFQIQDFSFAVSSEVYDALFEGKSYAAYYTPYSKTLVNIEPMFIEG